MSLLTMRVTCPLCGAKPHTRCKTGPYGASGECVSARFAALASMMNAGRADCDCERCKRPIVFRTRKAASQ